ncbi:MAG: DUF4012 domain-containing protein [Patescibacteria group bacterium]|nr:DUF4012 domain-containing protein [Patescibacteria group bacterium]
MPDENFFFKTEFDFFSRTLIVDEKGELATHLVDLLLSQGYFVYYFGKEKKEVFHYLTDKKNFCFLENEAEVEKLERIDYLFCFSDEKFSDKNLIFSLAPKLNFKLSIIFPLHHSLIEEKKEIIKKNFLNGRAIVFDEVFGSRLVSGKIGQIFTKVMTGKEVTLSGEPHDVFYPLTISSLVKEILKVSFLPDTQGKLFFVQGEKIKWNDFVFGLKKDYPEAQFIFDHVSQGKSDLDDFEKVTLNENLSEKVEETLEWFSRNILEEKRKMAECPKETALPEKKLDFLFEKSEPHPIAPKVSLVKEISRNSLFQESQRKKTAKIASPFQKILFGLSSFFLFIFIFFALPLILTIVFGALGMKDLSLAKKFLEEGNFSSAVKKIQVSQKQFSLSQRIIVLAEPFYSLIGLSKPAGAVVDSLSWAEKVAGSLQLVLSSGQEAMGNSRAFLNQEEVDWVTFLGSLKANLDYAYEQSSLMQLSLPQLEAGFKVIKQDDFYWQLKKLLPETRENLLKSQGLLGVLPQILSVSGRKTYLLLFQNNMELRPTGGFIGSYGIVNLENGKLVDFEVYDIYQADGQLKGHVEPPQKLKEYLGEANWYFRDSNWDPEFPVSARRANWFLDKETQIKADGVVAITLNVAEKMLSALGEVELLEYKEKVNKDNLFVKAEAYAELGSFPGSTQKKDFLGSLAKAIFAKMAESDEKSQLETIKALFSALEEREIQLYFEDQEIEKMIVRLGWDGGIRDYQPKSEVNAVISDFLYLNEANVGVNKANFFIKRKIDQAVTLNQNGGVEEKVTITYENTCQTESWPGGKYKNYLRLYLPKGAKVTSVLNNSSLNPSLWLPFDTGLMTSFEEHGKSVFDFLVEVPIKSKRKIEISYQLPFVFDPGKKLASYLLMVQKESGAYPSDYTLSFASSKTYIPVRVIPSAVVSKDGLVVSQKLDHDLIMQVDLAK